MVNSVAAQEWYFEVLIDHSMKMSIQYSVAVKKEIEES